MILKVPVTASNMVEWVRRAATAVNALITGLGTVEGRATALESRATDLETFAALPFTVDSITLRPIALPGTPADGLTVLDIADGIVKTYANGIWNSHY
jgi:hypothetical protein